MPSVLPPHFDGLNVIDDSNDQFSVSTGGGGFVGVTLADGEYFIQRHTGTAAETDQLMERVDTAIDGVHGGGNVTLTLLTSGANVGRIQVTNNHVANTLRLQFTEHTGAGVVDIGVLLGLIDVDDGASPIIGPIAAGGGIFTGVQQHFHGWWPNVPPMGLLGDRSLAGVREASAAVTVSPDGRVVGTKFAERVIQRFTFDTFDDERAVPLDATIQSYEEFWQRVLSLGRRFRYYTDRTDRNGPTGVSPFTYVPTQETAQKGSTSLTRTVERYLGLYGVEIECRQYVAS